MADVNQLEWMTLVCSRTDCCLHTTPPTQMASLSGPPVLRYNKQGQLIQQKTLVDVNYWVCDNCSHNWVELVYSIGPSTVGYGAWAGETAGLAFSSDPPIVSNG